MEIELGPYIFLEGFQVVREHYLRDDIYSGSPLDPGCPAPYRLAEDAPHYLIVDTNVVLQQVNVLCKYKANKMSPSSDA
jgi:hypothetical protein